MIRHARRAAISFLVVLIGVVGLPLLMAPAALAESIPGTPTPTVTADALPTVQIDGVVYSQVIVGDTVYATGKFTYARPYGSPPRAQASDPPTAAEVPRSNLIAYQLSTGNLISSWAPTLDGTGLAIRASADGSTIYIGGSFTKVNGTLRSRIAAVDATTGALKPFNPTAGTTVRAIAIDGSTIYLGGDFSSMGGQARTKIAAVDATSGALKPFAPNLDSSVLGLVVPAGSGSVFAGGRFQYVGGVETQGLAKLSTTDGALQPWAAYGMFPEYGPNAAINSMATDGTRIFASAYDFYGPDRNKRFENSFSADISTGNVNWINGCYGDTYETAPANGVLYTVGHPHDCSAVGGHPESTPQAWQRAQAEAIAPPADGRVNTSGSYLGFKAPELLHWLPTLVQGSFTGQGQAAWSVTANSQYVLLGGEFPNVNGVAQQGLTRFAVNGPNKEGPQSGSSLKPTVVSLGSGTARLSWTSAWDRDNHNLTYEVLRGNTVNSAAVLKTITAPSTWWSRPPLTYVDTTAPPGSTQTYRIRVKDYYGNSLVSPLTTFTSDAGPTQPSPYSDAVRADGASDYWRLGEASGTTAYDWVNGYDLTLDGSATRGTAGPLTDGNTATSFTGSATVPASTTGTAQASSNSFSVEAWVNTTSTSGGKVIGFGNSSTASSGSYDRHVYLTNAGNVVFGVYPGFTATLSSTKAVNDGQWHHIVGSLGSGGMELYVDGKRVGARTDVTTGQDYAGYWRIGGDSLGGWPGQPSSQNLAGAIDEVAVYPAPLTAAKIQAHYAASGRTPPTGARPTDALGQAVFDAQPDSYWRLNETSGTTAADITANAAGAIYTGGVTLGAPSTVQGTAVTLNGTDGLVSSAQSISNPTVYSEDLWFNTTTTSGGKLIGFGDVQSGGTSNNYDRHVWMYNSGQLAFGTYTGQLNIAETPGAYNDGKWHHMVATQGSNGMRLYVDGQIAATNPQTQAQSYTGYWRVGGDTTWGNAASNYFAGLIDDVAIYSSELTPAQVSDQYSKGPNAPVNVAPTAAFTSTATNLAATFDATTSADTDGTIAGYTWDFGDTTTGTGATTPHTYAAAGTYQVKLTVTDDKGATSTITNPITVTAANVAPTAAFTSTATNLAATFDATTSADTDGTIAGYTWDFGDTTTGTGATTPHTYAAAGTYQVKLTVTDDKGATSTITKPVTVTAPAGPVVYASDTFTRTSASGLGTADTGGAWTTTGAATSYTVNGATGLIQDAVGSTRTAYLNGVSQTNTELSFAVALDKIQTGGGSYITAVGRRVDASNEYRVRVRYFANNTVTAQLTRLSGGTETLIGNAVTVAGATAAAGESLSVRFRVTGQGTTTLAAKVWKSTTPEPTAWALNATDTTATLQAPGSVGLQLYLSGSATNGPLTAGIDNLVAVSPSP